MTPRTIGLDPSGGFNGAIEQAKRILQSGRVVAFPTETFYGLAVDAFNENAVKRLFRIKGRQTNQPILVMVASEKSVEQLAETIPPVARELMRTFWPGGLTLVFEAAAGVSNLLTAGTGKIGIRFSSHPVAAAMPKALGTPITGTSANKTGKAAGRNAQEVLQSLGDEVDLILDGGETPGRLGSTVLDVTLSPPQVLREGIVSEKALGVILRRDKEL